MDPESPGQISSRLSFPTAWQGEHRGPRGGRGLRLGPGICSRRARRAQRGNRRAVAALGNLRRRGRSLSPLFHPGGKQEARRRVERRTAARANEHCRQRTWRRMVAEKRGGTSGRAVTLFPPFGLEAPPFVFPAQSIKIGKKIPGPLRPCPPPLPASSPAAAAFAPHHV